MRARWSIVAATVGALVIGVAAPAVSAASPADRPHGPVSATPDGSARLHIAALEAHSRKVASRTYRLTLPQDAVISWLGQSGGQERVGAFTPKQLVAAWSRMGGSDVAEALTSLSWGREDRKHRSHERAVVLSDPSMTHGGQFSFLVRVLSGPLDRDMRFIQLGINPPGPAPDSRSRAAARVPMSTSSVTVPFPAVGIDSAGTASMQADVIINTSASVTWAATVGTNPCRGPINVSTSASSVNFPGFPCGAGTVQSKWTINWTTARKGYKITGTEYSRVVFLASDAANNYYGIGWVTASFPYTPNGSGTFMVRTPLALWGDTSCAPYCNIG